MSNRERALINLLKDCGVPYIWGGASLVKGVDCSGFTQIKLADIGLDPDGDQTADGLYRYFLDKSIKVSVKESDIYDLAFFGKDKITHVGICIGQEKFVEAGGGGSKTTTVAIAQAQGAKVRVSSIYRRSDLKAILRIKGIAY